MKANIIRPANREEWLKVRESGIGSSEASTILGMNPFETRYQLWRRKLGVDPPKEENFAMRAGHYLEDAVANFYADASGCQIIKRSAIDWIAQDAKKPFMQVSPDRTAWIVPTASHNDANKMIVECKTTQRAIDEEGIPEHWYIQLQYQLHVTGLQSGALAWLTQGRTFGFKNYNRNEEIGAIIEECVTRFWVDNIIGRNEPKMVDNDDVLLKFPRHEEGKVLQVDEETFNMVKKVKEAKSVIAELDAGRIELENKIKCVIGDAEAIEYNGERVATFRASKPSKKFDYKRFQAEHPDACKDYMVVSAGSRRLLIK